MVLILWMRQNQNKISYEFVKNFKWVFQTNSHFSKLVNLKNARWK